MREVDLSHLPLTGVFLSGACLDGTSLYGSHLEGAVCTGVRLERASFAETFMEGAMFYRAHLAGAVFREAHLEGANFSFAQLEKADLSFAHLERAFLYKANLMNADLGGAYLQGADLRNAHLEGASLRSTRLGGKRMDVRSSRRVRKWIEGFPKELQPANLRDAFFSAATILEKLDLGDTYRGCPQVADVHWGGVNAAVVDWTPAVNNLGDERVARRLEAENGMDRVVRRIDAEFRESTYSIGEAVAQDYEAAIRANRQLAVTLREQGISDRADDFAYRAQILQRKVYELRRAYGPPSKPNRLILAYVLEWLAGYGYRPWRTVAWYCGVIIVCAVLYTRLGDPMTFREAIVGSVTAFHGRGLFESALTPSQSLVAAVEAIFGLVIEVALIATFTWRFFGR